MGPSIASIVGPIAFVVIGVLTVVYRVPIASSYGERYRRTFRTSTSRPAKAFTPGTMVLVGTLTIVSGLVFLAINVQRFIL
jgi:hypothetical protein